MLYYKSKNENNNNNNIYIPECCTELEQTEPHSGCDCCNDSWTEDLIHTTNHYMKWDSITTKRQNLYNNQLVWRDKMKSWYDELVNVDEKADDLSRIFNIFISHLEKICLIIEKSNKAIEILFCMVEDLYIRVDNLKKKYDDLMTCIASESRNRPELASGGIIVCLTEYGKKLQAVIETRDTLIQAISAALEIAYKIHEYICLNERHCGEERIDYGLIDILKYWKGVFNGKIHTNHGECKFNPLITFPLDQSEYYEKVSKDWENYKVKVEELRHELDHAKEKRAAYLACKESLEKALAEVNIDIKCK